MATQGVIIILFKDDTTDTLDVVYSDDYFEDDGKLIIKHTNGHTYRYLLDSFQQYSWWELNRLPWSGEKEVSE